MTKIIAYVDLEVGKKYKVTETFEATYTHQTRDHLYFNMPGDRLVWVQKNDFDSAEEVKQVHEMWPPLTGEIWESPEGHKRWVRDYGTLYLYGHVADGVAPVSETDGRGWKPVYTERL